MTTFDRFDILDAYNIYSQDWGWDDYTHGIQARLARMHFTSARGAETFRGLSENARAIYRGLVERRHATRSGYVPCACCGDPAMGLLVVGKRGQVPWGGDLCGPCEDAGCELDTDECQVPCDACEQPGCRGECEDETDKDEEDE